MNRARLAAAACTSLLLFGLWQILFSTVYGAQLGNRALQLSTNQVNAVANYRMAVNLTTSDTLGSIEIELCSNDAFPGQPCTPPIGLDADSATLIDQTGATGFSIDGASTANKIILSRPPVLAAAGSVSYHFSGVTNPSDPGSYFVRVRTFASNDASGPVTDYGGIAFALNDSLTVSATVPPYLIFCTGIIIGGLNCVNATGNYIDFGELSSSSAGSGSSQLLVATNAEEGYGITINGTPLTSGNNVINALTSGDVSRPGVAQFGLNLRANATPSGGSDPTGPGTSGPQPNYAQPNIYRFVPGETVIDNPVPDDVRKYTASYIANIPVTQAPGVYVSTVTYICLANF